MTRLLTVPKGFIPRTLPSDCLTHSSDPRLTLAKPRDSVQNIMHNTLILRYCFKQKRNSADSGRLTN